MSILKYSTEDAGCKAPFEIRVEPLAEFEACLHAAVDLQEKKQSHFKIVFVFQHSTDTLLLYNKLTK